MTLDKITAAKAILVFSHDPTLALLVILGIIWWDRKYFCHTGMLMLVAGISAAALKYTFRLPLPEVLGLSGFGFPSGHMLHATVFYASIYLKNKNRRIAITLLAILSAIGYSMVYMGYHYYRDVFGGVLFALLWVFGYNFCLEKSARNAPILALIAATAMVLYLHCLNFGIPAYVWRNYYLLFGLVAGARLMQQEEKSHTLLRKISYSLFWIISIIIITNYMQKILWQGTPRSRTALFAVPPTRTYGGGVPC